jgi:serine/threonine-protein kinase
MALGPGEILDDKYRIIRLLGEGGMGAVYEGENTRIRRKVAIKVLHAAVAAKSDVVARFEREAQAAGHIGSEHIVEVLDLGSLAGGERFMVMEFLKGESLGDRIKRKRRLSPHEAAPMIAQLLEGLAAAHQAGIIHRDLKPDNVFLVNMRGNVRDFVKVLDFGVSKFSTLESDLSMTKTGAVMGTPFYMSPEQARGQKIDTRSDLYSVGVVMYQAVTGRVPFHAETFNELVFKIALEAPEPAEILTPGLEPGFAQIIQRAMVRDPAGRFQTAQEFHAAVVQWIVANGGREMMSSLTTGSGMVAVVPGGFPAPRGSMASASNLTPMTPSGALSPFAATSTAPLAQSGPSDLALSGAQPAKGTSGAVIAAVALGAVLVLVGGGFAAYKLTSKPDVDGPKLAATVTATASPLPSASALVVATSTPTGSTTTAPSSEPSTSPTQEPTAARTAGPLNGRIPSASAKPSSAPTSAPVVTATPTAHPTAPPTSTGRTVPGDL